MQSSECARAAGGGGGWLVFVTPPTTPDRGRDPPSPLSAWEWQGDLPCSWGPEMTLHLPPRSPGSERITPSPPFA